jgi:hypothetical protein
MIIQQMTVEVLGASYSSVDGNEYASLFVGQKAESGSQNAKGVEVMKLSCDPEVFRALDGDPNGYPVVMELHTKLRKAAGGKMGQFCVKALPRPRQPAKQAAGA